MLPILRPAILLPITLGCLSQIGFAAADDEAPASRPAVSIVDETWHDSARDRDVPVRLYLPAKQNKPAPTIVVSHGLGDTRLAMSYACEPWAADGFVVVTLQHIGSDDSVWKTVKPSERFGAILKAASNEQFLLRCGDVKFALDELTRHTAMNGSLKDRIDVDRIGLAGHSFGALTVQALIGQHYPSDRARETPLKDDRVKAAIVMSPGIEGVVDAATAFNDITVPVFHFTGTVDVVTGLGTTPASRRRVPYDRSVASDRYLLIFDRGDHMVFSGHRPAGANDTRYDHIQAAVARTSTEFWEATLRGNADARERIMDRKANGLDEADRIEHRPATTQPSR